MGPGHLHEEALENTLPGGGVIGDIFIPMICGSLAAEQRRHQLLRGGLRGLQAHPGVFPAQWHPGGHLGQTEGAFRLSPAGQHIPRYHLV